METLCMAEKTLVAKLVANGIQNKEAEVRIFHCCQCTSVETVLDVVYSWILWRSGLSSIKNTETRKYALKALMCF